MVDQVESVLIGFILISIILGLIVLNWTISFIILYKRKVPQILARHPKAVILSGLCFSTQLLITSPIGIVINGILFDEGIRYPALDVSYSSLTNLTMGAMSYLFIYRTWMIYYNIKWHLALQDNEWQLHIDSDLQKKKNWYLTHKNSYGNDKKCAFIWFTVWLLVWIAAFIFVIINGLQKNRHIRGLLWLPQVYLFPLIFFIIIACKLPQFNDSYYIRQEIKYVVVIWIFYTIFYFIIPLFINGEHGTIGYGFAHFRFAVWLTAISYVLIPWILNKFDLPTNVYYATHEKLEHVKNLELDIYVTSKSDTGSDNNNNNNTLSVGSSDNVNGSDEDIVTYLNILKDEVGFRAFSNFLLKSWAIENLLFILEMIQFKKKSRVLFENELSDLHINYSVISDLFVITENAPKSTLVEQIDAKYDHENNSNINIKENVCVCLSLLFHKYVRNGSNFCINVSYDIRNELYNNFGYKQETKVNIIQYIKNNKNEKELYVMFDRAIIAICSLLQSKFCVFQGTDEFKSYIEYLHNV